MECDSAAGTGSAAVDAWYRKHAEKEMKDLAAKAKAMMQEAQQSGQQPTPEQAQQAKAQFDHAQQAIIAHYGPMLQKAGDTIPIEDVMKLLRDNKARNFAFEIETDSTILADETEAKASATEFYTAFTGGIQGLMGAASILMKNCSTARKTTGVFERQQCG